ncbi:MAG TPA: TrkA family potassium uptake protein [Candidatus Anaerobutyricum stercoris]|uniref:TrkA family potassium uptake protein n=1 Tax=Candidatus Anaerobutyricum stercoris TaxID=2838457 RepID=A0A9D2ENQ0_9FIRM|nr:TrkA family potassium uptake protein [Eubacterium sp. An3]OUO29488.1 potassium transporter TrkA [Eubacterium sp. An3]CVI69363.1 Ktr system potassium uptake protein A [Eubacteriaceae bacterium CHKCI004]HIZ40681.1 TrkA family potassium uptake protein [Candidatus Anaerobutyricum stercoris]
MFGKQKKDSRTYGIIGLGRFGYALASELAEAGAELLVIDRDEEKVRELRDVTENAYVVKNLDKKSLLETGIKNCDVAVVCIGEQMGTSILTTLHLVSIGVPTVIAKANSAEHGEILERLGAEVVYPERDMAVRLALRLESSRILDFVQLSKKINITKVAVPDSMVGQSIKSLNLRSKLGVNIIAIENKESVMEDVRPEYELRQNDILYISGSEEGMLHLTDWIEKEKNS